MFASDRCTGSGSEQGAIVTKMCPIASTKSLVAWHLTNKQRLIRNQQVSGSIPLVGSSSNAIRSRKSGAVPSMTWIAQVCSSCGGRRCILLEPDTTGRGQHGGGPGIRLSPKDTLPTPASQKSSVPHVAPAQAVLPEFPRAVLRPYRLSFPRIRIP